VSRAGEIAGSQALDDAASDWQAVRASADIQFAPFQPEPPKPPPEWLQRLGEWLSDLLEPIGKALGMSWPVLEKVLIGLAVLAALLLAWRLVAVLAGLRQQGGGEPEPGWAPDRGMAQALLEEADRLAAEGRYGEAAHLLLQRSFAHIAEARPDWLRPASTAREIATLPLLPESARAAFAEISRRVERSLYALRELDLGDWQAARAAYSRFALAELRP